MNRKVVLILAAAILVTVATSAFIFLYRPAAPDPATQTVEESTKYLASAEFDKLSPERKDTYLNKLVTKYEDPRTWRAPDVELSEEEQERLRRNSEPLFQKAMENQINKYFDLPPEQRDAHMDKLIDQMFSAAAQGRAEAQRRQRAQSPSAQPREQSDTRNTADRNVSRPRQPHSEQQAIERFRERLESTSPEMRAKFIEFVRQFMKRMTERMQGRPPAQSTSGNTQQSTTTSGNTDGN